jgi:hypothetical protein
VEQPYRTNAVKSQEMRRKAAGSCPDGDKGPRIEELGRLQLGIATRGAAAYYS